MFGRTLFLVAGLWALVGCRATVQDRPPPLPKPTRCVLGGAATVQGLVTEVQVRCPSDFPFAPSPLEGGAGFQAFQRPWTLYVLEPSLGLKVLRLPAPAAAVRVWAHRQSLWVVAWTSPRRVTLLEHRNGWRTATELPGIEGGEIVAATFQDFEGAPPRLWTRNAKGEHFSVDPPAEPVQASEAPTASGSAVVVPGPELVLPPGEREQVQEVEGDESACRAVRFTSAERDHREALAQLSVGQKTVVLVARSKRGVVSRQERHELNINPVGGRPPPPRQFQCIWTAGADEERDRVLEVATVAGGYRVLLEFPDAQLLGVVGSELFFSVSESHAPLSVVRILKVDAAALLDADG